MLCGMSILFRLPDDVVISVLFWINLKSLVTLDNAVCNELDRSFLMMIYESKGFYMANTFHNLSFCTDLQLPIKVQIVHWIVSRNIKVSALEFTDTYWPQSSHHLFTINTLYLKKLFFFAYPGDFSHKNSHNGIFSDHLFVKRIIRLVNTCRSLKVLSFRHYPYGSEIMSSIDPILMSQLTSFDWSTCHMLCLESTILDNLINQCSNLKTLQLSYDGQVVDPELKLIQLIRSNKNLLSVSLMNVLVSDALLDALFQSCAAIQEIMIHTNNHRVGNFTLHTINKFMLKSIHTNTIFLIINGSVFGQEPVRILESKAKPPKFYFKSLLVSKKVFHDLVLLSESPVLSKVNFHDCLLYHEDQFVMCVNNWSVWGTCADKQSQPFV